MDQLAKLGPKAYLSLEMSCSNLERRGLMGDYWISIVDRPQQEEPSRPRRTALAALFARFR